MAEAAQTVESSTKSAGASGSADDIALIEERVDSGLNDLLEKYDAPPINGHGTPDTVGERYSIVVSQPVPEFDSAAAKAYVVRDATLPEKQLLGMVCELDIPTRLEAIEQLKGVTTAHLSTLHDFDTIHLSHLNQRRLALVLDRPAGTRLSAIFKQGTRFAERPLISQILTPLVEAVSALHERGTTHGRINPDNIFVGDTLVLGESVSEPQGLSQDFYYEPLERAQAQPIGKGTATSKSDAYAIGMLAYEALFGLEQLRNLDHDSYIRYLLEKGSYHLLAATRDIPDTFADFFCGIFTESKHDRWGLEQIRNWLGGKRYNLITPSLPNEASRPFEFNEKDYFNTRSLAHNLFLNWSVAAKEIRTARLDRWLEMSAHKGELADHVARIIRSFGGDHSNSAKVNNEMLSRLIIALDSNGPMRMKDLSLNVDGMGMAIAQYFKTRDNASITLLLEVVDADLPNYWADMNESEKTSQTAQMLWSLQQLRMRAKNTHLGFGLERIIYDLNPSLPCQNDMLLPYHANTAEEALRILDSLARKHAKSSALLERHLAAFLASKIDLAKEIKFMQLAKLPKLRDHPELVTMRIIALAQDKNGKTPYPGLACWAAMRIDELIEHIHSRRLRKRIRENLKAAAKTGHVSRVMAVLVENELTKDDYAGFSKATAVYHHNSSKIDGLRNTKAIEKMSSDLGGRIAVFVAYTILAITVAVLVEQYHVYL